MGLSLMLGFLLPNKGKVLSILQSLGVQIEIASLIANQRQLWLNIAGCNSEFHVRCKTVDQCPFFVMWGCKSLIVRKTCRNVVFFETKSDVTSVCNRAVCGNMLRLKEDAEIHVSLWSSGHALYSAGNGRGDSTLHVLLQNSTVFRFCRYALMWLTLDAKHCKWGPLFSTSGIQTDVFLPNNLFLKHVWGAVYLEFPKSQTSLLPPNFSSIDVQQAWIGFWPSQPHPALSSGQPMSGQSWWMPCHIWMGRRTGGFLHGHVRHPWNRGSNPTSDLVTESNQSGCTHRPAFGPNCCETRWSCRDADFQAQSVCNLALSGWTQDQCWFVFVCSWWFHRFWTKPPWSVRISDKIWDSQ